MGRTSVRLRIDSEALRCAMGSRETFTERAAKYGVTKQAVSQWVSEGKIPPRALLEIARDLDLSPEVLDNILAPQKEHSEAKKKWVLKVTLEEE